jgi:hypothetical protein
MNQANYMAEIKQAVPNGDWPVPPVMVQLYRWCLEHPTEYDLWQRVFKAQHSCSFAWLKNERESRNKFNDKMEWTHVSHNSILLFFSFLS